MKTMAKKKHKQKKKNLLQLLKEGWFYRIYFAVMLLCFAALAIGLVTLHGVMEEYEQTRPVHFAQSIMDAVNQRDWSQVYEMDESARKLRQETPEQYAQYMNELTQGKTFTLKSVLSINDAERKYNILMDGQKFAEMVLEPSGETTAHDFEHWRLKSISTTAFAASEYTVTAPADSVVYVNGQALTQADIIESGIATEADGNLPEGVPAPTLVKYGVYMSFGTPDSVTVTDKSGKAQEVTQLDERNWSCGLAYDDSIKAQVEGEVVKWGRRIAAYTTGDYSKSDLSRACINPSPARTYIRNMENQWAAAHDGYDFQNIKTFDYYIYSDSCFSCKISFDYIVHYKKQDKSYPTNYTLYFAKDGGQFKLYSFTMH